MDYELSLSELAYLKQAHKRCKQRKKADRIKAVYLLGSGWKISSVKEALLLSEDTIRAYFKCYQSGGLKDLLQNKHLGKASHLTDVEQKVLSNHLEEHTYARVADIIHYIEQEFDVIYSHSGVRRLLAQLGFVYKKPEKVPYSHDPTAQADFIEAYNALKSGLSPEDGVYFMDATHPEHTPIPAYGWIKRGETKVVKANPRPYRLNINGAINIDTLDMVVRFEKRINAESMKDFLEALRAHQPNGWIHLICDNAGYNQSQAVKQLAEAMAIKLVYLPPYSPNLNLIERVWKFFKKKVLYNKHYAEFQEMEAAAKKFFRKVGDCKPELASLLTEKFQQLPG